jgi:type II secretory pathway component PulM
VSEFAIRLDSIDALFWHFDARPVAERQITADVRWHLLDEWERVRALAPDSLVVYAPAAESATTDEGAVTTAIRSSLRSASGPLRRVDPLSRQEKVAAWIGVAVLLLSIVVSTAIGNASEDLLAEAVSQGVLVLGWVAVWAPASRFIVEVAPHVFNRRRYAEFAEIDVRFAWV